MKRDKNKRHNPVRVSKNLWFMLKYSFKYAPSYTLVTLGEAFGRGGDHIISVLLTKYIFDAIEKGTEFKTFLFWVLLATAYNAAFELFNKWRLEVYVPKVGLYYTKEYKTSFMRKRVNLTKAVMTILNSTMTSYGQYSSPTFVQCRLWKISVSLSIVSCRVRLFSDCLHRWTL